MYLHYVYHELFLKFLSVEYLAKKDSATCKNVNRKCLGFQIVSEQNVWLRLSKVKAFHGSFLGSSWGKFYLFSWMCLRI